MISDKTDCYNVICSSHVVYRYYLQFIVAYENYYKVYKIV